MKAEERILADARNAMREAIADAGGNEVFFIGEADSGGMVFRATPGARGHAEAVPVLNPFLSRGNVVLHNHPSGALSPSDADLRIASRLGNQGIGFYIVDNPVEEIYAVAEPVGTREAVPLDVDRLKGLLAPSGPLSRILPSYEERPGQAGMLALVAEAFNEDELAVVEAGTGVGKSLAYLLPALAWAEANEERVVVSTATINLQQQLVEKDIPLARRILGSAPKAVLVKGRGNYLCRTRLIEAMEEASLFEEADPDLAALKEWADVTETGSRSDLPFILKKEDNWSRVCSESDVCLGLRCAYRESCFVLKSRREAASARILVANHHLLFSDLALRVSGSGFEDTAVLPPFQRIIFDEAHHVEKSASSFFSRSYNRLLLAKCLGRIVKKRKGRLFGLYVSLRAALGKNRLVTGIPKAVEGLEEKATALDEASFKLMGEAGTYLCQGDAEVPFDTAMAAPLTEIAAALLDFLHRLEEITERLRPEENETLIRELRMQAARLSSLLETLQAFRGREERVGSVFWTATENTSRGQRFCGFTITPLSVAPLMHDAVFQPFRTVVFTSATLTVGGSFSYWAGRIGLDGAEGRKPVCDTFPSPFDYGRRVLLAVPTDAPPPDQPGFLPYASGFLRETLVQSGGRALVLFTSYATLLSLYEAVRPEMDARGIPVFKQGDGDRARLLTRFKEQTESVLFATDSFWEGVDAPGETLSVVVICRLPFRVPSEPVLRARMEAVRRAGGNPFSQLSLPDAVVKLRQGFGRLMRRRDDGGVVLVLDSRLANKPYGEVFLESLPPARRAILPTERLRVEIAEVLERT